jgi:hypothetical protein
VPERGFEDGGYFTGLRDPIRVLRRLLRGAPGKEAQKTCQKHGYRENQSRLPPHLRLGSWFLDTIQELIQLFFGDL